MKEDSSFFRLPCLSNDSKNKPRNLVRVRSSTTSRPFASIETLLNETSAFNSESVLMPDFHITLLQKVISPPCLQFWLPVVEADRKLRSVLESSPTGWRLDVNIRDVEGNAHGHVALVLRRQLEVLVDSPATNVLQFVHRVVGIKRPRACFEIEILIQ